MFKRAFLIGLLALCAGSASAQFTSTAESVAAVDNIPPSPVTDLQALVAGGASERSVALTWTLSADDALLFTSSIGGAVVPSADVRGYKVYRADEGGSEVLLATLSAGVSEYVDATVEDGASYIYSVRPFDLDNETDVDVVAGSEADLARIVLVGGPSEVAVKTTIKASMRIGSELNLANEIVVAAFTEEFIRQLAALLGINPARITITGLASGSVIVSFEIAEPDAGSEELSATDALSTLKTEVESGTDAFDEIGGVLALDDESTSVLVPVETPLDSEGNPILGWFTRQGDQVGFDDFFLFADYFGTSAGDAGYDARFDIVPDGSIDFGDFFRLADDFGKVVANASVINGG